MQNTINAILQELIHLQAQVASPIQNLQVAQVIALYMRHVEDNIRDIIKKVKVEAHDFDGTRDAISS